MGFWIFMLLMTLFVPLIMIIFGAVFSKRSPHKINYLFGYRTTRSMKNEKTWEFAHKKLGKIWKITGFIVLIVSVIPLLFLINADKDTIGSVGSAIVFVQLIPLIASIFPVESALKKNFDDDGNPK